ncbi:MAG: hypothetical protein M1817_000076 [Caeruleum heppii]|nr:MAG: hypothetical protein M1817_000076 [Caeruleum heppii]
MGKAGRLACIFLPMILTLASLICLVLVALGGTNSRSSALNNLYFFKADTTNFRADASVNVLPGTDIDDTILDKIANAPDAVVDEAKEQLDIKDFYTVALWGYCSGTTDEQSNATDVESCSKPRARYYFDPIAVWKLNNSLLADKFPDELETGLRTYRAVTGWMYVAYVISLCATVATLLVGVLAIFSRWGSLVTTIVASTAAIFTLAASGTATGLYGALSGTLNSLLKNHGIRASLGRSMMITTWLATAFSCAAAIFWLASVCCCSGRTGADKKTRVPKNTHDYERVGSPYGGQRMSGVPMRNLGPGQPGYSPHHAGQGSGAYEPYRHGQV